MRAGFKYVTAAGRSDVDSTPEQFAQTMGYGGQAWADRESFLAGHSERWVLEMHEVFLELLDPQRSVLSVGSGEGEHEVRLAVAGYDVTASDVVPGVLDRTAALFPELRTTVFDAFSPGDVRYDDVLVTGMDFYFEDGDVVRILRNLAGVAGPGGRVLLTLRYPDTAATWAIDRVLLPAIAVAGRLRGTRLSRKHHGWRRSRSDVIGLARRAGLEPRRIRRAALGQEAARLGWDPDRFRRIDRRTGMLTGATVFELVV